MERYLISLKECAADSLNEALSYWESIERHPRKRRLAIILTDNFIELFLKFYVYTKSKKQNIRYFFDLLREIEELGYNLKHDVKSRIEYIHIQRNKTLHQGIQPPFKDWHEELGSMIYFILRFDEENNNYFDIKSLLSDENWNTIIHSVSVFEKHFKLANLARDEAEVHYGDSDYLVCPFCEIENCSSIMDNIRMAFCHFCRENYKIEQCMKCGTLFAEDNYEKSDTGQSIGICEQCIERELSD